MTVPVVGQTVTKWFVPDQPVEEDEWLFLQRVSQRAGPVIESISPAQIVSKVRSLFGHSLGTLSGKLFRQNDATTRPVHWAVPLAITGLAVACFATSLLLPAAKIQVFVGQSPTAVYEDRSGAQMLFASFTFAVICGFINPIWFLFPLMNASIFVLATAMLLRPSFKSLRRRAISLSLFCCVAFTGIATVDQYVGWWMWVGSFLLASLAHWWPIFVGRDSFESVEAMPGGASGVSATTSAESPYRPPKTS